MVEGAGFISESEVDRGMRVINLSLDLEHLISTLPLDPNTARPELIDEVRNFRDSLVQMIGHTIPLNLLGERPGNKNGIGVFKPRTTAPTVRPA
jgi:hypothetical protein